MHLSSEAAFDLIENRLEDSQAALWFGHLEQCPDCDRQLKEWGRIHSLLKGTRLVDAPSEVIRSAKALFQPLVLGGRPAVPRITAWVTFDSLRDPAFAGTRGAGSARQLVWRAEEFDIHIKIRGSQLIGQIMTRGDGPRVQSARLHLLREGERLETTAIDRLGEFEFKHVPDGLLSLQVDLPYLTVVGALDVRESGA